MKTTFKKILPPELSVSKIGEIRPGGLLTATEARARLGLGDWAWRQLVRSGLRIIRKSGRAFVLADDLIAHFALGK